jgi:uncharacterized protein YjcR
LARAPDARVGRAKALFDQGLKLIDIAKELELPAGTVRRWKSTYNWESERSEKNSERSERKRGAQPGNKNASGPPENKHAEKHGLFAKYLPEETLELVEQAGKMNPLDVLWDQIMIQYAAIIRAQKIMHVKDQEDKTIEKIGEGSSDSGYSEKWEVQQAWDKQANFLKAQARAMTSLNGMIKTYDDLLHRNWELASDEQKARIENIRASTAKIRGEDTDAAAEDDGFLDALKGEADDVWQG